MQLAWLTDIHLNFLKVEMRQKLYANILATACDALLISGDIAEAPSLTDLLCEMAVQIKKPIYFILGNHDYYRGTVGDVRKVLTTLSTVNANLFWLPASGLQQFTDLTFSSKAIGDVLMLFANDNPSIDFLVLCGHTHSDAKYQPRTNLIVKVGKAEYYKPVMQEIITV